VYTYIYMCVCVCVCVCTYMSVHSAHTTDTSVGVCVFSFGVCVCDLLIFLHDSHGWFQHFFLQLPSVGRELDNILGELEARGDVTLRRSVIPDKQGRMRVEGVKMTRA